LTAALGALVLPTRWQQLQTDQQELLVLEAQRERLPLLRRQLDSLEQQREQAERRNALILGLIAGSGELNTFLAQLSQQAAQTGVMLDGYEPIQAVAPPPKSQSSKDDKDKANQPPPDPLLAPGLKKTSVLLSARGSGPQLLDFLRRLERLSLLVVQSDLSLKSGNSSKDKTELRLTLGLYERDHSSRQKPGNTD
jgi:type IV pilus assembly protein PilO